MEVYYRSRAHGELTLLKISNSTITITGWENFGEASDSYDFSDATFEFHPEMLYTSRDQEVSNIGFWSFVHDKDKMRKDLIRTVLK